MTIHGLLRKQVEQRLKSWYGLERKTPSKGWLRTVREALGMSAPQLADRIGITRQGISDLEAREREGSVTLAALMKAAHGMNCDLVYAIVPRTDLTALIENQAREKAIAELRRVAHTMRLEDQATEKGAIDRLIQERIHDLLTTGKRRLWERSGHGVAGSERLRERPRGHSR